MDVFPTSKPQARPTVTLVAITPQDHSDGWSWQWRAACQPMLELYLAQRYPVERISIQLVDDPTISLGVAYPAQESPDAVGLADCHGEATVLTCRVAVGHGESRVALATAVTGATIYAIREWYRPTDRQTWDTRPAWDWSVFEPLLEQKEDGWESACLMVSPS